MSLSKWTFVLMIIALNAKAGSHAALLAPLLTSALPETEVEGKKVMDEQTYKEKLSNREYMEQRARTDLRTRYTSDKAYRNEVDSRLAPLGAVGGVTKYSVECIEKVTRFWTDHPNDEPAVQFYSFKGVIKVATKQEELSPVKSELRLYLSDKPGVQPIGELTGGMFMDDGELRLHNGFGNAARMTLGDLNGDMYFNIKFTKESRTTTIKKELRDLFCY